MHCYLCYTYLVLLCGAFPTKDLETSSTHQRRSLFHDVIESIRMRAKLPELFPNDENHLGQSDEPYGFDNEPLNLPNDIDFIPRRNDRTEIPALKHRFPKNLDINNTKNEESAKEEIVLFINSPEESEPTTMKPKKTKRPRPALKNKTKTKDNSDEQETPEQKPVPNSMSGQSQIGNRESQTVVKPTVIVNFRGSVSHRDSDIRLERRKNNNTQSETPQNVFNINQEIKLERGDPSLGNVGYNRRVPNKVRQDIRIIADGKTKIEEDMMMCETNSWKDKDNRSSRHLLQIFLSV